MRKGLLTGPSICAHAVPARDPAPGSECRPWAPRKACEATRPGATEELCEARGGQEASGSPTRGWLGVKAEGESEAQPLRLLDHLGAGRAVFPSEQWSEQQFLETLPGVS